MNEPAFKPLRIDMSNGLTYSEYMKLYSEFNAKHRMDGTAEAEITGSGIADRIRINITMRQLTYLYYMQLVAVADPEVPVLATKEEYAAYLADKTNNCVVLHNAATGKWAGDTLRKGWCIVPEDVLARIGDKGSRSLGYSESMLRYMWEAAMYHAYGELPLAKHKSTGNAGLEKARALLQQASDIMRAELDGAADGVSDFIDNTHPQLATLIDELQLYLYPEPKDWRVVLGFNGVVSAISRDEAIKAFASQVVGWAHDETISENAMVQAYEVDDDSQRHG